MRKQQYWFTLVELIVVITILAILWTIAFISLQWYSADARNSTRISDIGSMKKTLELYQLKESKYPIPDWWVIINYDYEKLRTQWTFWNEVVKKLWKLISKTPVDPLTKTEYIYSLANNEKEYEVLAIYEWDKVVNKNILNQANAANFTAKVSWNYNWVFVKTENYIVPVPSLINSEVWNTELSLDLNNIKSQVVTWKANLPKIWDEIELVAWTLSWLVLSTIWSIDSNSTDIEKIAVMDKIQEAYVNSDLTSINAISYVLNANTNIEKAKVIDNIVIWKTTKFVKEIEEEKIIDTYWDNVVLLLKMEWDDWSSNIIDEKWNTVNTLWWAIQPTISTTHNCKFWNWCLKSTMNWSYTSTSNLHNTWNSILTVNHSDDFDFWTWDFTLDTWIYPTENSWWGIFWKRTSNSNDYWPFVFQQIPWTNWVKIQTLISTYWTGWEVNNITSNELSINNWYHIALVRNGQDISVYINWEKNLVHWNYTAWLLSNTSPISIMWASVSDAERSQGQWYNGYFDDFRITKWMARYTENFDVPTITAWTINWVD